MCGAFPEAPLCTRPCSKHLHISFIPIRHEALVAPGWSSEVVYPLPLASPGLWIQLFLASYGNTDLGKSNMKPLQKNPPAKAGDIRESGLFPGLGGAPGGGHGGPLQCSRPENSMDRGA